MIDSFLSLFNPIFYPLIAINDIFAIAVMALFVSFIVALAQKRFTDQALMKQIKLDLKSLQAKMKTHRKNPEKMLKIQGELLEKQKIYMFQSFRPMLITIIPIMIIFTWIALHLAYMPLEPNESFTATAILKKDAEVTLFSETLLIQSNATQTSVNQTVSWIVSGEAGVHQLIYSVGGENITQSVLISENLEYKRPTLRVRSDVFHSVVLDNEPRRGRVNLYFFQVPSMFIIYILFSIVFSIIIRRRMGIA